jgi:hypothetical protein
MQSFVAVNERVGKVEAGHDRLLLDSSNPIATNTKTVVLLIYI